MQKAGVFLPFSRYSGRKHGGLMSLNNIFDSEKEDREEHYREKAGKIHS